MIHLTIIKDYPHDLRQLAEDLGDLRYDALSEFLHHLSQKIEQDGSKDAARNRFKLATTLKDCSEHLSNAKIAIDKAWEISEPYV